MNLGEATLDLARYAQGVEQHTITKVDRTDNSFRCLRSLAANQGEYTGGTCWFLTGKSKGRFSPIEAGTNQWIMLQDPMPDGYEEEDEVALGWSRYFNTQNLVNAINHVLNDYPIMAIWDGETIEPEDKVTGPVYEFQLPEEVTSDIRRVELESFRGERTVCHYWRLNGRTLEIDPRSLYKWGGAIRIHYVKEHGAIYDRENQEIDDQVDHQYLRKMANLWLWTHEIQMKHKDNPIAVDMYNQAKMDEDFLNKRNLRHSALKPKDRTYYWQ